MQKPLLPIASLSTDTNAFTSTIFNRHPLPSYSHENIILNKPLAVNSTISTIQVTSASKARVYSFDSTFTSIKAKIDNHITRIKGPYSFCIHGEIYHHISSLLPPPNLKHPLYVQIYVYDMNNEIQNRLNAVSSLDELTLTELQNMLHNINLYVQVFQQAGIMLSQNSAQNLTMLITDFRITDSCHYNIPNSSKIATILVDSNETEICNCNIILYSHTKEGEDRWHLKILICDETHLLYLNTEKDQKINNNIEDIKNSDRAQKYVTMMQYYAYYLQVGRPREGLSLHLAGHLFQQYIVNTYAIVKQNHLNYLKHNQQKIQVKLYSGLQDALAVQNEQL
ncbi:7652_t:CDS:2 [Cetraspora pellucida]|uniref:7652_t:CDS:1 n=1 Tax=Cetraspora pellucida TaxID=1433469 RepID=A0A9N9JE25_9GLOM|nr:7652_t:CDS:2 [Cetraspora pellucida]